MSIAEQIRSMNAKFVEDKTAETLKGMTLEQLAQEWNSIERDLQKEYTHEDKERNVEVLDRRNYEKNKKETMGKLSEVITPEILQSKLDEYIVSLSTGQFEAGDFHGIASLIDSYADTTDKEGLKQRIADIKNKISDKRLNITKPINLINSNYPLNYETINIEADQSIMADLTDKKSPNGKTVTFRNQQGEDVAGIQFNKDGGADILLSDKDGNAAQYRLSNDGRLGRVHDNKTTYIDAEMMTEQDKKAMKMAEEAEKVWINFAEGKMDSKIEKEQLKTDEGVNVNEGADKGITVNEGTEKDVTVNQDKKETSKVHEFNPLVNMRDPTKVNEGEKPEKIEKREAEVGGDDLNPHAKKEDEEYWKEGDIIDTMFKWLVSGANSATNFCVHQIEYFAGAVWHQFEKDVINAKAAEPKQANSTQKLYKESNDIFNRHTKEAKKNSDKKRIAELLKEGKTDTILAENPAFAALYEKSPSLQKVLTPEFLNSEEGKKNAPAIISSTITMVEDFTNRYAKESILDEKFNNKSAFNDENLEEAFAEKKKQGIDILTANMEKVSREKIEEITKDDPELAKEYVQKNLGLLIAESMNESCETIRQAGKSNNDNYKDDKYSELGKIPDKNIYLDELNSLTLPQHQPQRENEQTPPAPEPISAQWTTPLSLPEEVEHNRTRDNFFQTVQNGFEHEEAVTANREESIIEKRRRINEFKKSVLQGLGEEKPQGPIMPSRESEDNQPHPPLIYRGR